VEDFEKEDRISVSLRRGTIEILDEVAKKKDLNIYLF